MNIKEVSTHVGITPQNIRFYESKGLVHPFHNPENNYREYSEQDIQDLLKIKLLRSLDIPLDQIKMHFDGRLSFQDLLSNQLTTLTHQSNEIDERIALCRKLIQTSTTDTTINEIPESWLEKMKKDYLEAIQLERISSFTFTPKDYISTPAQFKKELENNAFLQKGELIMIDESMHPSFLFNNIPYHASVCYVHVQVTMLQRVRCELDDAYLQNYSTKSIHLRKGLKIGLCVAMICVIWILSYFRSEDISAWIFSATSLSVLAVLALYLAGYYFIRDKH